MNKIKLLLLLFSSTSAVIFDCDFGTSTWTSVTDAYTCRPIVTVSSDETTLTEVRGNHLDSKTNEDVQVVWAQNQRIVSQLPKDLEKFFPNLIVIAWSNGDLSSITAENLKPFPNLTEISLDNNLITTLDGDTFQYTKLLKAIYIDNNQLTSAGPDLLENLNGLEKAFFTKNPCIDMLASNPDAIQALKEALASQCPPSTTTTQISTTTDSGACICSSRIKVLEQDSRSMQNSWDDEKTNLRSAIEVLGERLKAILVNQCPC